MRDDIRLRAAGALRTNVRDLVMGAVMGQIAHPIGRASPYRIGHDGVPRILPGSGGINLTHRVGDRCVGLAGDHIEPGVSIRNNSQELVGDKNSPNLALLTYACVGNTAVVVDGPCKGKQGIVTGKHGGIEHVIVDFPASVLRRLRIGDKIQVYAYGLGMKFVDHPGIKVFSCSPRLARRWGLRSFSGRIQVPVTHLIPGSLMGSGIGKNNAVRGDYDIQLFDPAIRRRFNLETLRFGDFVAIADSDSGFGRAYRKNSVTVGLVVHGDSTVSGHGPGVLALLASESNQLMPVLDTKANLAAILGIRGLQPVKAYRPLVREQAFMGGHYDGSRVVRALSRSRSVS
jgi:hypothetical protein